MFRSKPLPLVALAALVALGGCKIVSDKDLAALENHASDAFDATAYVGKVWTPRAIRRFKEKAVDLKTLLPEIAADPDKAGKTYGRGGGEGNPWTYEVRGEGKVTAIDVASRHGLMTVEVPTDKGPEAVELQIGPVIFGTALRDSLPFIRFGDFVNQIQFAQVSRALNDRATRDLSKEIDLNAIVGKSVTFYGAATPDPSGAKVSVTPIAIETAREAAR
jgi:predicted lipoprotein